MTGSGQVTELWRHKRNKVKPKSPDVVVCRASKANVDHIEVLFELEVTGITLTHHQKIQDLQIMSTYG